MLSGRARIDRYHSRNLCLAYHKQLSYTSIRKRAEDAGTELTSRSHPVSHHYVVSPRVLVRPGLRFLPTHHLRKTA
eukprot:1915146-Pleurochrysis_carterae.AAC.4